MSHRRPTWKNTVAVAGVCCGLASVPACGKKGPPLPPLVKLPTAPQEITAVRRGDTVELQFKLPATNTDNTRPANVERVDVYAITGPVPATDVEFIRRAARVASVTVKAPRDPDLTTDPEDEADDEADVDPPEGPGLDQGAMARVSDRLTEASLRPPVLPVGSDRGRATPVAPPAPPAPPAPAAPATRTYLAVGVAKNGRTGPPSRRAAVPLAPPPPPPADLQVTYDDTAIRVSWAAPAVSGAAMPPQDLRYHVYELPQNETSAETTRRRNPDPTALPGVPLTKTPVAETRFSDPRVVWGERRCYVVRSAVTIDALTVESEAVGPACVTFVDTFPPAAPRGLMAVASEGSVSLIWEPNGEADLDGYIVLRGAPGERLLPVTTDPLHETSFRDIVTAGRRFVYAVQAVDKAGNVSAASASVEETAR